MAPRLPPVNRLADDLRKVKWSRKQTVGGSLEYLVAHRDELAAYEYPEDLGVAGYDDEQPDARARALAVNLDAVRNAVLEELWRREIFLGTEVVDQLLFYAAKREGERDPLMATLEFLRDRRATRPGMILFPLHSFGILRAGLLRGDTKERVQFIDARQGLRLRRKPMRSVRRSPSSIGRGAPSRCTSPPIPNSSGTGIGAARSGSSAIRCWPFA
jgi:hypothetical protein